MNVKLSVKIGGLAAFIASVVSGILRKTGHGGILTTVVVWSAVCVVELCVVCILIRISKKQLRGIYNKILEDGGEVVLFADAAPMGFWNNGGHLLLTDEGLEYYPNLLHFDRIPVMIRFEDIKEMIGEPRELVISSDRDKDEMRFQVQETKKWCELTAETMKKYGMDSSVVWW